MGISHAQKSAATAMVKSYYRRLSNPGDSQSIVAGSLKFSRTRLRPGNALNYSATVKRAIYPMASMNHRPRPIKFFVFVEGLVDMMTGAVKEMSRVKAKLVG